MVNEILTAAGIPYRRGRLTGRKAPTEAVYMDDITSSGPDGLPGILHNGMPRLLHHDITVELYEDRPDDEAEKALEDAITAAGLQWTKQDRYWLRSEQMYQVVYEFNYIEKRRA